jgi:hypothetical protein
VRRGGGLHEIGFGMAQQISIGAFGIQCLSEQLALWTNQQRPKRLVASPARLDREVEAPPKPRKIFRGCYLAWLSLVLSVD